MIRSLVLLALVALPAVAAAQFGHPLEGQWSGAWGPREKPNRLLLNLRWDGKDVTGEINPGTSSTTIRKVIIDFANPSSWVVKMEAEGKDATGAPVPIAVDGRLENIGAYRRILRGVWTQGGQKGEFLVTRN
jgi:hypothetical protein